MDIKAVIFDLDGLLIDSMWHWMEIDKKYFQKRGAELTNELIKELTGRSVKEGLSILKQRFGWEETIEDLIKDRNESTDIIYSHLSQPMPGADALIKSIAGSGLKQAIATGASLSRTDVVVNRFNWKEYFDQIVSVDHVDFKGKPAPDVFLYAAKALNILPEHCVVLEDAENGVASAKAAGMRCVAVKDDRWSFGDFSRADLEASSLADEKIHKFIGLV